MALTKYQGFTIPEGDLLRFVDKRINQAVTCLDAAVKHCREKRVAVQAGGNFGIWAQRLSELFGAVYTFEPDATCFDCLAANTQGLNNVIRIQSALGDERHVVDLAHVQGRSGSTFVQGAGIVPTLRIDDLGLRACDLIYLDIEGMEFQALRGAEDTITRCKPVIAFEDKQHGERYGVAPGEIASWLAERGYKDAGRIEKHDAVMVPWP